jgi:hypothetical protein
MTAPLHMPKKCSSCSAEIFWAQLPSGRSMPVDAEPTPDGNVVLLHTPEGSIKARVLKKGERPTPGAPLRSSHFSTCPNAKQHRKAKPQPRAAELDCDPDWTPKCESCGASPVMPATGMCGPCTTGEADTMGGDW